MAYLHVSRLCRLKLPLVCSISLNVILFIMVLKWCLFNGSELKQEGVMDRKMTKRAIIKSGTKTSCYIFVLILTAPGSTDRRTAIRKTWLTLPFPKEYSFAYKFVVGTSGLSNEHTRALLNEEEKYGDFLRLANLKDSYHSLTLKVLQSFVWIVNNINAKFILKVDDDSFVRLESLVVDLQKKEKFGRIYWGFFRGDAKVKTAGPWKEPNWILCDSYLPYANGGGYVLSLDLVSHISKQRNMLQLYNSEDVSVGTWLAPVRLNRVHDVRFDTEYRSRGCNDRHIISHKQTISDMFNKYEQLVKYNRLCDKEEARRLSFDYNWKGKPSQCCKRRENIP